MPGENRWESNVFEVLSTTRAMRRLRPDPVPDELVARIIDAATRSPAGGGVAGVRFVVLTDQRSKDVLAGLWHRAFAERRAAHFDPLIERHRASHDEEAAAGLARLVESAQYLADHIGGCPLVLFAFGRPDDEVSAAAAMWSACLAARSFGIGSVFTRILVRDARAEIEELLGVDDPQWRLHGVVPMGYPRGRWAIAPRPAASTVCYGDRWGHPVTWTDPPPGWWRTEQ